MCVCAAQRPRVPVTDDRGGDAHPQRANEGRARMPCGRPTVTDAARKRKGKSEEAGSASGRLVQYFRKGFQEFCVSLD